MRKIQTLVLLLSAYAAAAFVPGPGLALREFPLLGAAISPPQLLLAVLLFCAGLCSTRGAVQSMLQQSQRFLVLAFVAWLVPLVAALATVSLLWAGLGCPASVALGVLIVAAMPVANSSVGWSASLGGSTALSIGLLVVGTALSPVISPLVIGSSATFMGTAEETLTQTPWNEGMGQFFLWWVLVPVLLGVLAAGRLQHLSRPRRELIVWAAKRVSFWVLIALNYLNGAACLPPLTEQPHLLAWPLAASGCLLLLSAASCHLLALVPGIRTNVASIDHSQRVSVALAILMRNTGAALVFAGAALPEFALVSITIIGYTMLQHLWVGFFLAREFQPASTDTEDAAKVQSSVEHQPDPQVGRSHRSKSLATARS